MLLDDLVFLLENRGDFYAKGFCLDCKNEVLISIKRTFDAQVEIKGGAIYKPEEHLKYDDKYVYKCDECFKKDSKIYARTEVYSRSVGYIRPVNQWNEGKQSEFMTRKMYDFPVTEAV
jgi:hypothetical protein